MIVASSSSVYGSNPTLPKHEMLATLPVSPYAASKLATEQYTLAWQKSFGLKTLAFRFFNVYGPRQAPGHAYAAVVPAFAYAALSGEALQVHGDGTQSRDFTYVGTLTDVIVDAVRAPSQPRHRGQPGVRDPGDAQRIDRTDGRAARGARCPSTTSIRVPATFRTVRPTTRCCVHCSRPSNRSTSTRV